MTWATLRKHLGPSSLLLIICTSLTGLLVYQELVTFVVTRPTTTSSEEQSLNEETFPEVSACLEPAFNSGTAKKHGYNINTYYRGSMDGQRFVGWNGEGGLQDSADILDDILTMKLDQQLVRAEFQVQGGASLPARISYKPPVFPLGDAYL